MGVGGKSSLAAYHLDTQRNAHWEGKVLENDLIIDHIVDTGDIAACF
jgi:hypothetical protein